MATDGYETAHCQGGSVSPNHLSNRRGANPRNTCAPAVPVKALAALVPSRSNPDEKHLVCWASGRTSCTCEGWRARGHCYHIAIAIDALFPEQGPCPQCGKPTERVLNDETTVAACIGCEWAIVY